LHGVKNKRGNVRKRKVVYIAKRGYDAEKLAVKFGWTFLRRQRRCRKVSSLQKTFTDLELPESKK
jgi:hypothetical protein